MRRGSPGGRAALGLALWLGACHPPAPPPQVELPYCREAWAALPPGATEPAGGESYADYLARLQRRRCRKPWSVLVYMAADNDLTPYAYLNLYEMEAGRGPEEPATPTATTVDTEVLVRLDTPGRGGLRRLHVFADPGAPYDPARPPAAFAADRETALRSKVVALDPEPEALDVEGDLRAFLRWGIDEYPAERHLVVVWGHGQGYGLGAAVAPRAPTLEDKDGSFRADQDPFPLTGGVAFSWTRGRALGVPALAGVLRDTVAGPLGGRPIAVYLADACLMHSLEVTSEVADTASYLVGSIQVQDYLGMAYRDLLRHLNAPPPPPAACAAERDPKACALAEALPGLYQGALRKGVRAGFPDRAAASFTLAATRSQALRERLQPALAGLWRALSRYVEEGALQANAVRGVLANPKGPSFLGSAADLGVLLTGLGAHLEHEERRLRDRGGLSAAGLAVRAALQGAHQALAQTTLSARAGTRYQQAPGFAAYSLWSPQAAEYQQRAAVFRPSRAFQSGRAPDEAQGPWPALLDRLYR